MGRREGYNPEDEDGDIIIKLQLTLVQRALIGISLTCSFSSPPTSKRQPLH